MPSVGAFFRRSATNSTLSVRRGYCEQWQSCRLDVVTSELASAAWELSRKRTLFLWGDGSSAILSRVLALL